MIRRRPLLLLRAAFLGGLMSSVTETVQVALVVMASRKSVRLLVWQQLFGAVSVSATVRARGGFLLAEKGQQEGLEHQGFLLTSRARKRRREELEHQGVLLTSRAQKGQQQQQEELEHQGFLLTNRAPKRQHQELEQQRGGGLEREDRRKGRQTRRPRQEFCP